MADVYSLVCWGGRAGKTATMTIASPCVVTINSHGLRPGMGVIFSTTGALPTGVTAGTTYYVGNLAANTFNLYDTEANGITGGATGRVNTSGTQSGTHTATGAYWSGLTVDQKARYGTAGSERAYDSLGAWNTGRSGASAFDIEYCEIGEGFDDIRTSSLTINVPSAQNVIWTKVNGTRSGGWHGGNYPPATATKTSGYRLYTTTSMAGGSFLVMSRYRDILDGLVIEYGVSFGTTNTVQMGTQTTIQRCFVLSRTGGISTGSGITLNSPLAKAVGNIVVGFGNGIKATNFMAGVFAANNLCSGCTNGIHSDGNVNGFYYNNISIGNTTNWTASPGASIEGASNNAGETGNNPWGSGDLTVATTDFADYANKDFRPALSTSPQVNAGVNFYDFPTTDLADDVRPAYEDGSDILDAGPYEWDFGNTAPNTVTVSLSGMVDGSRISINKVSDGTELRNELLSSETTDSFTYDTPSDVPVYLYLRKGSASTYYQPVQVSATITAASGLTYSFTGLQSEDIAAATYTAGVATDWTINWSTGAIAHALGTTRYSVQDLYSYHQDESDSSTNIDASPKMRGVTPTIFEVINNGSISDGDIEDLFGGSIEFQDGTLWSNVYNVGTLSGSPTIYIYQGTSKITAFWSAGDIDVLLKVIDAGAPIASGLVTGYARKWGYTYDHYEVDLSNGGRNVMPLATLADSAITETEVTVGGWTDVTISFGTYSRDFGDGDGARTYYCEVDCANRPLAEVYQRLQYVCRGGAAGTLNGAAAETYQRAHSSVTANKQYPFGSYAGGVLVCAPTVWLTNVPAADNTNYIVTDSTGVTHQNAVVPGAAQATVLAGSRVQLYNVDTATEIDNTINADTSYSYAITTEAAEGETLRLRVCKLGYEPVEVFAVFSAAAGATFLASQVADAIYTSWGIDGSTVTEFSLDVTGAIEIDSNDVDGATTKTRLGAWYNYALTTEDGIRTAFGAITALAVNAIRINVSVVDMTIENINATTALRFTDTDVRLYRSDGTTIIAASSYSIHNDYSGVPDVVETGVSGLTGPESAQLMSLTNAPSASTVATQVWADAPAAIDANVIQVGGATIGGSGTALDPWGPT
jgi:hypothetical protein